MDPSQVDTGMCRAGEQSRQGNPAGARHQYREGQAKIAGQTVAKVKNQKNKEKTAKTRKNLTKILIHYIIKYNKAMICISL
jgi:hypothetical protein